MLILAIDTSGRRGSIALCEGVAERFNIRGMSELEGGTYSARLVPMIDSLLKEHELSIAALDAFAVVSGPGSFTGLRVGLATVKGLCEALQKPLIMVSMLEAVAVAHGTAERVTAILDAGRGEVYVGEYELREHRATTVREHIVKPAELTTSRGDLITSDRTIAEQLNAKGVAARLVASVQADGIGRIALRKLLAGDIVDHATVDVNYIRRSDAEIFSAPKR